MDTEGTADTNERVDGYLRALAPETDLLAQARARCVEAGIPVDSAAAGALLAWCARLVSARHAVEVGSDGGYRALWLLRGMDARGALTTVEVDPERQAVAQRSFADSNVADRVRSMLGPALTVLPKLADDHYELVYLDATDAESHGCLEHAKRLLRPGGMVVAGRVLAGDGAAEPSSAADADTDGPGAFVLAVRDDPELDATVTPVGGGMLLAVHRPEGGG